VLKKRDKSKKTEKEEFKMISILVGYLKKAGVAVIFILLLAAVMIMGVGIYLAHVGLMSVIPENRQYIVFYAYFFLLGGCFGGMISHLFFGAWSKLIVQNADPEEEE
jgi:hypothetical protein